MNKIIVVVSGGVVQEIFSKENIFYTLIDFDDIKQGGMIEESKTSKDMKRAKEIIKDAEKIIVNNLAKEQ